MKTQEKLLIKNFGPIVRADIDIKPFMVFIGESGSGKSVVLKLLSLFRWIHKKAALRELSKSIAPKMELYRFRIEKLIRESGLEDFCVKGSKAEYFTDDVHITISINSKPNLKISVKKSLNFFEKISFITDDRFTIPMLLNNQIRGTLPYHLEKTYEDFNFAFEHLQDNKNAKINTIKIELSKEKYGIQNRFFINDKASKIQLHNASSGMKSVSIIEVISSFFATNIEYMQEKQTDFILSLFSKNKNPAIFANVMDNFNNLKIDKYKFSLFIEEPELSLFPNAQKKLVEYLVNLCFHLVAKKRIQIAFSTHSPYILSSLNCLLLAHKIATSKTNLKAKVENIIPSKFWLDNAKFQAFKVENGEILSIIDKETNLILADKIDEVSDEISEIFNELLNLESLK